MRRMMRRRYLNRDSPCLNLGERAWQAACFEPNCRKKCRTERTCVFATYLLRMTATSDYETIPRPSDLPYVYTPEEAAAILKINQRYLIEATNRGEFPHMRMNQKTMRFTSDHLREILASFEVRPESFRSDSSASEAAGETATDETGDEEGPDEVVTETKQERKHREWVESQPLENFPGMTEAAKRRNRLKALGMSERS